MRETKFIEQNKEKWLKFESEIEAKKKDPNILKNLFIQITDDLSFSRTFYPNRSVRVYLNSLAQRIFFRVYRGQPTIRKRLARFWFDDLPHVIYEARKDFLLSFLVFSLAFGIGILSSMIEPDFPRYILGDMYIDQTIRNIEAGDPMAVYKDRDQLGMSMGITLNNLWVALLTFVLGTLAGVGSVALLLTNGIMIGAFQYFFIQQGLFWESFFTVWTHGTLEISSIIIAGAAGITMGRGLTFPGTYTRMQAFQRSARRGLKILIGIVPVIILAGFIEGYLTRYTDTPNIIRACFIAVCLFFVLIYFVWYPRFRSRISFSSSRTIADPTPDVKRTIDFSIIKSAGDVFADVLFLSLSYGKSLFKWSFGIAIFYISLLFLSATEPITDIFFFPNHLFGKFQVLGRFFNNPSQNLTPLAMGLSMAVLATVTATIINTERGSHNHNMPFWKQTTLSLLPIGIILMIIATQNWYTFFLLAFVIPIPLIYLSNQHIYGESIRHTWKRTRHLLIGNYWRSLGLFLMLMMICFIFFCLLDTSILLFYLNFINLVVYLPNEQMEIFMTIIETLITVTGILFLTSLVFMGFYLQLFSLEEIRNASFLRKKIKKIQVQHQIKGLAKE